MGTRQRGPTRVDGVRVVFDRHGQPVSGTNGILIDQCWEMAEQRTGITRKSLAEDWGYYVGEVEMWVTR